MPIALPPKAVAEPARPSCPDQLMDLADASLIAVAESVPTKKIFTLDRKDFSVYRLRRGHRHLAVEIVG